MTFLRTYNSLVTGVHETGSADWLHAFKMPGNKAKSISQERVLHFKKYQWFDYNAEFGRGTLLEEMAHGVELSAKQHRADADLGHEPGRHVQRGAARSLGEGDERRKPLTPASKRRSR
jgi:hypothetical protein